MKKLRIAVLMGGPSSEHDVSLKTGGVILKHLNKEKYDAVPLVIPINKKWEIPEATDVAFIALHGAYGEDGTVQAILESADIPYTGSGVLASALAMDKVKSAELFSFHGLNVPKQIVFKKNEWVENQKNIIANITALGIPCVIKPSRGGSSVGISILKDINGLHDAFIRAFEHDATVIAQQYIKGVEVSCGVLDEGKREKPTALPPVEILSPEHEFYDYHAKYTAGGSEHIIPPRLAKEVIQSIENAALTAHNALGCSGMSRTDMIVAENGTIYVLETNTIPGMTETSLYPQAAAAIGISFEVLLDKMIQAALKKK